MLATGAAAFLWIPWGGQPATPTMAVLPFADFTPGGGEQYLAHGVAEDLLQDLIDVPGLRVVAGPRSPDQGQVDDLIAVS
ncbi:MAG: hypothetical protein U5Q16_13245 [Gammaproteobacteria bacterium]|nr:hypothetical protein [Gammaproteobacteria bacterium]